MNHQSHNKLVSFIWSIADDCLRDVYVRGKYRDIILPFVVLRRIDSLLEPTKDAVLEEARFQKEDLEQGELDPKGLEGASGYVFYNTSTWTMEKLKGTTTNSQQKLVANFEEYLNGFSDNVKEIIEKFNLSEMNVNQHVCIIRSIKINHYFLKFLISSDVGQSQIWFYQQGGGREGLNFQNLKNFQLPVPTIYEQGEIVTYLDNQTRTIDVAVIQKQEQILKLKEYKQSLINEVVTGKVRIS